MQEMWVWSLDWEDSLAKEMATHSSILAWKIPWAEELGRLQCIGLQRIGNTIEHMLRTIKNKHIYKYYFMIDYRWYGLVMWPKFEKYGMQLLQCYHGIFMVVSQAQGKRLSRWELMILLWLSNCVMTSLALFFGLVFHQWNRRLNVGHPYPSLYCSPELFPSFAGWASDSLHLHLQIWWATIGRSAVFY